MRSVRLDSVRAASVCVIDQQLGVDGHLRAADALINSGLVYRRFAGLWSFRDCSRTLHRDMIAAQEIYSRNGAEL
jgi:hypothetical protein